MSSPALSSLPSRLPAAVPVPVVVLGAGPLFLFSLIQQYTALGKKKYPFPSLVPSFAPSTLLEEARIEEVATDSCEWWLVWQEFDVAEAKLEEQLMQKFK